MSEKGVALGVDVLTIFPDMIEHYCEESILARARRAGIVEIQVHDLRDATSDARRTTDDTPFGGGAGMVFRPEPIFRALELFHPRRPIIYLTPAGRPFRQSVAHELADLASFTLLCGRYEGLDQRAIDHCVDEEISIGDYVLSGGELAALVVIEAVARLVPGVVGNEASIGEESFTKGLLEYPQYTRPAEFAGQSVPEVLTSGDHGRVARWRLAASLARTRERRPDLIEARGGLSQDEVQLLLEHGYPV